MKNEYFGDFLFLIMLIGTLLFLGCASDPSTRNTNVSLDRAIKIAVENLEQGVGESSSNNATSDASSAEREMQSGQTDFDSIRQRAQGFTQRPVIAVLSFNSTANTLSEWWEETKESAYLKMIQFAGIAFQSDEDFSYFFDELGIRWSFLPFTSIGFDLAFGGNTNEPVSDS